MSLPAQVKQGAYDRVFPEPDPYAYDPTGWMREKLGAFLWTKQREIMESVRDNRFTAVPSCHGPGKSWAAARLANWWIDVHPPGSAMIVTTAPSDAQVKAILWKEIKRGHKRASMPGRITLDAKWYQSDQMSEEELIGIGRKPQDYDPDMFQGIHAKFVLILVDEAGGVAKSMFDALETLMTNDYARMLAIGNPDDPTAYFETICRPGSGWKVIKIPVWDTPNFTKEYVPTDLAEQLVTPLWVEERRTKWGVGSPLWQSKVEAEFPEISDDTLISPHLLQKMHALSIKPNELGMFAWDIARFGSSETVGYLNRNGHMRRVFSKHKQDTVATTNVIAGMLFPYGVEYVPAIIDVVGIGGGVVDSLNMLDLNIIPFNGGDPAFDDRRFRNRRAEAYWKLREMAENDEVDLDPFDEPLSAQLTVLKWAIDRRGRIYLESKEDMRRRGLPSPDRADCVMMGVGALAGMRSSVPRIITMPTVTGDLLKKVM